MAPWLIKRLLSGRTRGEPRVLFINVSATSRSADIPCERRVADLERRAPARSGRRRVLPGEPVKRPRAEFPVILGAPISPFMVRTRSGVARPRLHRGNFAIGYAPVTFHRIARIAHSLYMLLSNELSAADSSWDDGCGNPLTGSCFCKPKEVAIINSNLEVG